MKYENEQRQMREQTLLEDREFLKSIKVKSSLPKD